jgi:hypothetical protein
MFGARTPDVAARRATTPAPIDNARMRAIVDLTKNLRPPQDEEPRADLGPYR